MDDQNWSGMLRGMAGLPRSDGRTLGLDDPQLADWLGRVMRSSDSRHDQLYRIDLHLSGDALWQLPERFAGCF